MTSSDYAKPFREGIYTIQSVLSPICVLDLGNGEGTAVSNHKHGGVSQQWSVEFGEKGYRIRSVKTRAYLSYGIGTTLGCGVLVTTDHGNVVEWVPRKSPNGYRLWLAKAGYMIGVLDANQAQNTNIVFWVEFSGRHGEWNCDMISGLHPRSDRHTGSLLRDEIETLKTSIEELRGQLKESQTSVEDTKKRLGVLEESVARAQGDTVLGQESVVDIRNQLSTANKHLSLTKPLTSPITTAPIPTGQLVGLGQKFPALEARTEKLAKSFGQTQDYLIGVQKFLQTTRSQMAALDRAVPAAEAKSDRAVESLSHDLSEVRRLLEGLDRRMALVEGKTVDLSDTLGKICGPHSASGSPFAFPSHSLDTLGPLSTLELDATMSTSLSLSPARSEDGLPRLPERFE